MADKTMYIGNNNKEIDVIVSGKVVGENIKNKGSATKPVYFDGEGIAQPIDGGPTVIKTKVFDDVWSGPINKTTAELKAINSGKSGTTDGTTWPSQYRIYFGKIRPTGIDKTSTTTAGITWDSPWHIRMRVIAKMFYRDTNGNKIYHNDGNAIYDWNIYGSGTTCTYANFNNKYNWTPTYYHMINRPQAA